MSDLMDVEEKRLCELHEGFKSREQIIELFYQTIMSNSFALHKKRDFREPKPGELVVERSFFGHGSNQSIGFYLSGSQYGSHKIMNFNGTTVTWHNASFMPIQLSENSKYDIEKWNIDE